MLYINLKNFKGCEIKLLQTGDIIKKLRIENKYTQSELAIMLDLQLSTLQKYESGAIQNLKLDTLRELCHIFDVPPIVFVFPNIDKQFKKALIYWLLREYSDLNDVGSNKVIEYINDLRQIEKYRKVTL